MDEGIDIGVLDGVGVRVVEDGDIGINEGTENSERPKLGAVDNDG